MTHLLYFSIRLRCLVLGAYLFYWQRGGQLDILWRRVEVATGAAACGVPALVRSCHRRFQALITAGVLILVYFNYASTIFPCLPPSPIRSNFFQVPIKLMLNGEEFHSHPLAIPGQIQFFRDHCHPFVQYILDTLPIGAAE